MKKIAICLMATCLSLTLLTFQSNAATTDKPSSSGVTKPLEPVESAGVKTLLKRVDQFNAMDNSKLISHDKKNSQVEISETGRHHRNGGVVYVSAGAVILIVLLVIILL